MLEQQKLATPELLYWVKLQVEQKIPSDIIINQMKNSGWNDHICEQILQDLHNNKFNLTIKSNNSNTDHLNNNKPNTNNKKSTVDRNFFLVMGQTVQVTMHLENPKVTVFDNFLTDAECHLLINGTIGKLTPSAVVDNDNAGSMISEARTSLGGGYVKGENVTVESIEKRIELFLNYSISQQEPMQVLNYKTGAQYKSHFDYFDVNTKGGLEFTKQGGNRLATVIMYLNDVEEGGSTYFPVLGLSVRPKKGRILVWRNLLDNGQVDPRTQHSGTPVILGEKWIATKWIREGEFKYLS